MFLKRVDLPTADFARCFLGARFQDGVQRVMEAAILQQGDPVEVTHG